MSAIYMPSYLMATGYAALHGADAERQHLFARRFDAPVTVDELASAWSTFSGRRQAVGAGVVTATVRVREDIRHGDYRNVRVCDVVATRDKVLLFLQGSPYATAVVVAGNPYVERVIDGILAGERRGLGWGWYDVLPAGAVTL